MADEKRHQSRVAFVVVALFFIGLLFLAGLFGPRALSPDGGGIVPDASLKTAAAAFGQENLELMTAKGSYRLDIEVARSPEQQALGLMYRTALPENYGMLFPHVVPREAGMWMKNTYVPLDMVFLSETGRVHHIVRNTEPHSTAVISSNGPVAAVLELPAGAVERYGLRVGDQVRHSHFTE